jgi:eukaryotic-like serine/threonine-protein kinase
MTPERWQQVKGLLQEALEIPTEQRTAFLDTACKDDLSLRQEVESLLLEESEADEAFLQSSVNLNLGDMEPESASWVGRRIGSYEIIEEIGEGGMGSVYRAARADEQYQKQVAIKIVKHGFDTPFALARFRAERQILANLEHPNIARLLDGGTTENGLPYVVMELVEGKPIDEYCNTHRLSVEERLRLFRTVCLAVQYAHQHLVVHRDLKPGNILVTADGTPKLLDFGIAKILDTGSFPGGAEATVTFMRMLTPEYASPEQIRGETVTTASDIYSLGVILFLLLTGQHPYKFDSRSADAVVRAICDTEPRKPSTAVRKTAPVAVAGQLPAERKEKISAGESSVKLSKRLRGDLDNIVLLALRKDPQRRYASAEQFGEDIRRHLENLPVIARNDTVGYRIGKFVTRHRTSTVVTAVAAMFLVAALCVALYEARVARQQAEVAREQRARAEKRFNDVRKLANSLIFEIHDSIRDLSGATQARELLVTRALEYLDSLSHETGDPALQRELAAAYDRIGDVQGYEGAANLGDYSGAAQSYAKALAIRETLAAANPADQQLRGELADEYFRVAAAFDNVGDFAAGLRALQRAQAFVSDPANTMDNRQRSYRLAGIYYYTARAQEPLGDFSGALHNYQQAAAAMEPLAADPHAPPIARAYLAAHYLGIGKMQGRLGQYNEAVANVAKGRDLLQQLSLADQTNATLREYLADSYNISGDVLEEKRDLVASLRYLQQAQVLYKQLASTDPHNRMANANVGWSSINVAENLLLQGKPDKAMPLIRNGLAIFEKVNPQKGYWYAVQMGQSYLDLGKAWAVKAKQTSSSTQRQQMWRNALDAGQKALAARKVDPTAFDPAGHDQLDEIRHQIGEANAALSPAGAAKSSEEAAKK